MGVSPEARVEGGMEMGLENPLGLTNSGPSCPTRENQVRPRATPLTRSFVTRGIQSRFGGSPLGVCKHKNMTHSYLLFFSCSNSSFPNILTYMSVGLGLC